MQDPLKRTAIVIAFLLPIVTVVLIVFRDAVREAVVVPLIYLAWLGDLTFASIGQAVFWGLLLALTAISLFFGLQPTWAARASAPRVNQMGPQGGRRVAYWARQLARGGNALLWDLSAQSDFRKLILAVWAYHRRVSLVELEVEIKTGAVELPPQVRVYFDKDDYPEAEPMSYLERVISWLRGLAGSENHSMARTTSGAALDAAVRTLEAEFGATGVRPDPSRRGPEQGPR